MLGFWSVGSKALGQLDGSILLVAAPAFLVAAGRSATCRVQMPEATGAESLAGVAAAFQARLSVAPGSHGLAGNADASSLSARLAAGAFALAANTAQLAPAISAPIAVFAETGAVALIRVGMAETELVRALGAVGSPALGELALGDGGGIGLPFPLTYSYGLIGNAVIFDPAEAVVTVQVRLAGFPAALSYELLGGGGVISGGTFSRRRWLDLLDEIGRERATEARRLRDDTLRRRAEKERALRAAAEARRLAREAAKADGEAIVDAIARSNALRAVVSMRDLAAALQESARRVDVARDVHEREVAAVQDEEEALLLLLVA